MEKPESSNKGQKIAKHGPKSLKKGHKAKPHHGTTLKHLLQEPKQSGGSTAGLVEPQRRKTMFDQMEIELVRSGKKPYFFRLILLGTHDSIHEELIKFNSGVINDINEDSHDESVTGFLLLYPKYFVHILEGSEETLNNYLASCSQKFEDKLNEGAAMENTTIGLAKTVQQPITNYKKQIVNENSRSGSTTLPLSLLNVKVFIVGYFSTEDRLIPRWFHAKFNPQVQQVERIHGGFRHNLFQFVRSSLILALIMSRQPTLKNGEIDWPDSKTKDRKSKDAQLVQYLPSLQLIQYILKDKPRKIKLRTPREFIEQFWDVPNSILESETVWPIPCRIAPYD